MRPLFLFVLRPVILTGFFIDFIDCLVSPMFYIIIQREILAFKFLVDGKGFFTMLAEVDMTEYLRVLFAIGALDGDCPGADHPDPEVYDETEHYRKQSYYKEDAENDRRLPEEYSQVHYTHAYEHKCQSIAANPLDLIAFLFHTFTSEIHYIQL